MALHDVAHDAPRRARGELVLPERILRAGAERAGLELRVLGRVEQHDGHEREPLAEPAQRVETAGVGEGEVEEDEIRRIGEGARGGKRRDVRDAPVAAVGGRLQGGLREMRLRGIVLDEEDREGEIGVAGHGIHRRPRRSRVTFQPVVGDATPRARA